MEITYASQHKWSRPITKDVSESFGKGNTQKLRSILMSLADTEIAYEISPLNDETIDWFTPLYNEAISSKKNPKIFDVRATTIGKDSKYKYYSLVIFEDKKPIGATIFSERGSIISIAYRIYPNNWSVYNLQASPSLYAEYLINEHGSQNGFKTLSHGRDRNPYGLNSHIGLAIFKLSIGCSPSLPSTAHEVKTIDLNEVDEDILILKYPTHGVQITEGILYVTEENRNKYVQVTKYPDRISIETIIRTPK